MRCKEIFGSSDFFIHISVLILAGVQLIFFIGAGMGLRFGFVLKTVLVTQGRFSCC